MTKNLTDRETISTYVPANQKAPWEADADEMGMSMSEFIRCMAQAGRRGFDLSEPINPRQALEDGVIDTLRAFPGLTWDDVVEALSTGVSESVLEGVLQKLLSTGTATVRRDGRYELAE